jgi:uncharacterized membrane protein HdeD (DUF308 family)
MDTIRLILQLIIALGICNVWILRFSRATPYRPENAKNMKEEFSAYGLPDWFMGMIGVLKILLALCLIAGVWMPGVVRPAAIGMAVLMVGAVMMHFKVRDPARKSVPAFVMLVLSLIVAVC